jgi:hypothetical protein
MVATIIGFVGAAELIIVALWIQSVWFGVLSFFMLTNCWKGLSQAQALSRLAKLPRHEEFACPCCKTAPPIGKCWRCGQCGDPFDAFQAHAVCPHCATHFAATMCMDCRRRHPMNQWIVLALADSEVAVAHTAVVQSVSESED